MDVSLTVETSRETGTRAARRLRATGKIPGVVYGLGTEAKPVVVEWPDLRKALSTGAGVNALIDLTVDGDTRLSMVKDLQRDPVRRTVTHVDFLLIDPDTPLSVDVPVSLVGTAPKLDALKGMVDQLRHTLTVSAKPGAIPNALEADISDLDIGTAIKAGDIPLPDGVTSAVDPDVVVAQGSATRSTLLLQGKITEDEGEEGEGGAEGGEAEAGEDGEGD
ncbi:MAG: 50S ribosomal protein L25 [Acidimicrobiales bacterium]